MSASLPNIQVTTVNGPNVVEVVVGGEIDLETSPILEAVLASAVERSSTDVRVDLSEVSFLDSSGIRLLATIQPRLAPLQRRLILTNTGSAVARVLAQSGMANVFGVDMSSADQVG